MGGEVRVRNLVHRGAPRPVFKLASVKLERTVQCESALEHEATILLDADPHVEAFAEQPVTFTFREADIWRHHIPDFVVLSGGKLHFLEIKFSKDVDGEVSRRTSWFSDRLSALGAGYGLLTETSLRDGVHVENARRVLRRARHPIDELQQLTVLENLRDTGRALLASFGWNTADSLEAIGIAKLMMRGRVAFDPENVLSERTCVWVADSRCSLGGSA